MNKHPPGTVRDAIVTCLRRMSEDASVSGIRGAVERKMGGVPASSVRLRPEVRTGRGRYRLRSGAE